MLLADLPGRRTLQKVNAFSGLIDATLLWEVWAGYLCQTPLGLDSGGGRQIVRVDGRRDGRACFGFERSMFCFVLETEKPRFGNGSSPYFCLPHPFWLFHFYFYIQAKQMLSPPPPFFSLLFLKCALRVVIIIPIHTHLGLIIVRFGRHLMASSCSGQFR